jgi:hypothetical protein
MKRKHNKREKNFGLYLTQAEGFVLGVGAKLFTLAGPVLVYGITASVIVGLLKYFFVK